MDESQPVCQAQMTLLLGGVRSGKSANAVRLATAQQERGKVLFVATAQPFDDEMASRIAIHRRERPETWETLEAPLHLATALEGILTRAQEPYAAIVIDCVTLWVSNILLSLTEHAEHDDVEMVVAKEVHQLLDVYNRARVGSGNGGSGPITSWIIVSNEVGLGVVPPTPLGRYYRDALGRANQQLAAVADDVLLMVAGLTMPLKGNGIR